MSEFVGWHRAVLLAACGMALALCSCVSTRPANVNASVRRVSGIDRQIILDTAEVVLLDREYLINERDDRAGMLRTKPIEGAGAAGDRQSAPLHRRGRTRRIVDVILNEDGNGVRIHCKVVVQEQDTQSMRLMSREQSGHEPYSDTPIDRDAATTDEQNTYWQTVRRDRLAERELLAELLTRLGVPIDETALP
ncbi:MAG: hypothetical protein AABZ47_03410 [Planctomycetota bacterium]